MAGKSLTGAVLAGLVVGGVMGIADLNEDAPEPADGGSSTVVEQDVQTDTSSDGSTTVTEESTTVTEGPTAEAESNQFVEQTDSGTVRRESTVTSSTDDGGG